MRLLLNLFLTALAFVFVLPLIQGISFHGGFLGALVLALFFGLMLWVVDLAAIAVSAMLTISSFGIALLWLIPLWIVGFWLLPAVALKLVADMMPNLLTISGWLPAILGGVLMLFIGILTSGLTERPAEAV